MLDLHSSALMTTFTWWQYPGLTTGSGFTEAKSSGAAVESVEPWEKLSLRVQVLSPSPQIWPSWFYMKVVHPRYLRIQHGSFFPSNFHPISIHWIGLRENLNRKPMGFYHQIDRAFRFSNFPIIQFYDPSNFHLPSVSMNISHDFAAHHPTILKAQHLRSHEAAFGGARLARGAVTRTCDMKLMVKMAWKWDMILTIIYTYHWYHIIIILNKNNNKW